MRRDVARRLRQCGCVQLSALPQLPVRCRCPDHVPSCSHCLVASSNSIAWLRILFTEERENDLTQLLNCKNQAGANGFSLRPPSSDGCRRASLLDLS